MGLRVDPAAWRVLVNPAEDSPEQKSLALLVMPPDYAYAENGGGAALAASVEKRLLALSLKCGRSDRHYRTSG